MNSLLKLWMAFLFLAALARASDSDDDSASVSDSVSDDDDSPPEPTLSPSEQALDALIQACPCLDEVGGDDGLSGVRDDCPSDSGECAFWTSGDTSTLNCDENQVVLDAANNVCYLNEWNNGAWEREETYNLTPAQTTICTDAIAGVADDLECTTPAPTAAPTQACSGERTINTNTLATTAGNTPEQQALFAEDLISQMLGDNEADIQIISTFTDDNGNLGIVYELCADSQDALDAALQSIQDNLNTPFEVLGVSDVQALSDSAGIVTPAPTPASPMTQAPAASTTLFL